MLNKREIEKYSRQIILEDIGEEGQLKLKKAKVMVVGAGGLGCPVLLYLTAAGVGNIGVADFDIVDGSNLHRQVLYDEEDIGKSKAEAAAGKLRKQNSLINIVSFDKRLNKENVSELLNEYEVIVDCTDNFKSRYLIDEVCDSDMKPMVYGSVHRFQGQVSVFHYYLKNKNPPTYRCLFPKPPEAGSGLDCSGAGVIGVLPGIIGTIQAAEVIKIITGIGEVLSGKVLCFDMLSMESSIIRIERNPLNLKLPVPGFEEILEIDQAHIRHQHFNVNEISADQLLDFISDRKDIQVIDVRENKNRYFSDEIDCINIPRAELENNPESISRNKDVILICENGNSSYETILTLNEKYGFTNLLNLKGGVRALQRIKENRINK